MYSLIIIFFVDMAGNSFGTIFKLSTYGESHGKAIGGIIEGCPPGLKIDLDFVQSQLDKRKPGQSKITTQRKESDQVEFLSGIFEGISTGTPIAFQIVNEDAKSKDYSHLKDNYRPSHADYVYDQKYGHRDYRGGGRSSARETACRVVAGAIAIQLLNDLKINAYVSQVGELRLEKDYSQLDFQKIENTIVRCPDTEMAERFIAKIDSIRKEGDTIGGMISCVIENVPVGLGEPVFDKLHAELAKAMMSINAVKGFEYGSGFKACTMQGSEHNDIIRSGGDTECNFSGGIQGGISNGQDIYFNVAFKPVATLMKDQKSIDKEGNEIIVKGKGRHDPCVVPRAVPIVEAMAALVLVDFFLLQKINK